MKSIVFNRLTKFFFLALFLSVFLYGIVSAIYCKTTLSSVAASYIDSTLPHKKNDFSERMTCGLKVRGVSLFVYPLYALSDILYLVPKAGCEYLGSFFIDEWSNYARQDMELAKRTAIGLVSTPLSIISADYVTRHFLPERKGEGVIESGGSYYSTFGHEYSPKSIEEVQLLVNDAKENSRHISISGAGLSQGTHYFPCNVDDILLNLKNLKDIHVDADKKVATVGAGATWQDVQAAINPHRLAIKVMQASNIFSVGGSFSANCHGWDHHAGTLASTVKSILIVDANGELRRLTPQDHEFGLIAGGYGLCGVIVQAELELTDNSPLIDTGEKVALNDYVDYFNEKILADENVELHLYRLSLDPKNLLSEGVAQNYLIDDTREKNIISPLQDEKENGRRVERVGVHSARKFCFARNFYWNLEKKNILKPIKTSRNEVMRAPIKALFNQSHHDSEWLQEFFLPEKELASFVDSLGKLLTRYNVCLLNASVRYVKQDRNALLGYAKEGDRFAVVLCFNQPLNSREVDHTREWIQYAIDLTLKHGGTYYLPYQHFATSDQFKLAYPHFSNFALEKNKIDPKGIFTSQFYEHHKELATKNEVYESEAFYHVFSDADRQRELRKFLRNIFLNLNEEEFMQLAEAVVKEKQSDALVFQELEKQIASVQPNAITGVSRSLKALKNQKKELKKQIKTLMAGQKEIDGYVEIGFPGRMVKAVKRSLPFKGRTTVVHTEEALSDYVQCGFPRAYDNFVSLDDYKPLTHSIDRNSVDLVSCFIGLHHCPEAKLDSFIGSIAEVLRPEGSFLLRDHDVNSQDAQTMATLAHSTFNLGTGVPWSGIGGGYDESSEIRNFRSLLYWDAIMKQHGLIRDPDVLPLIRPGDPTRNSLVRYVKQGKKSKDYALAPEFVSQQHQTFMTTIEWHSVRVAGDYADFIEHTPFYMYPYFGQIKTFWKSFNQSWKEARRYNNRWEIIFSDSFLMNLFISTFHTVEYTFKGLVSWPVAALYQVDDYAEKAVIRLIVKDPNQDIASYYDEGIKVIHVLSERPRVLEIEMPKFRKFRDVLLKMTNSDLKILNIAGQKRIQVQCTGNSEQLETCESFEGCRKVGVLPMPTDNNRFILYLNVEVGELLSVLQKLESLGLKIDYVHDF